MSEKEKFELFQAARKKHKDITPCSGKTWDECFIEYDGVLHLFFNTPDHNTHVINSKNLR